MNDGQESQVTVLIGLVKSGDAKAMERLVSTVYGELRQMASKRLRHGKPGDTLNTTALVHEAYLKLAKQPTPGWNDREHFFRAASLAMRHIIVDTARRRKTSKRGNDAVKSDIPLELIWSELPDEEVLALDEALTALGEFDERLSKTVEMRYFVGLSIEEIADVLERSPATVKRDWTAARAWLMNAMN